MLDTETLLLCAAALFVGGFTKGVAGLGLPMIAIPLLVLVVDLQTALVLLALPGTVSNLVQAFQRGAFIPVMRRFWPLLVVFIPAIGVGAKLLVTLHPHFLYIALGIAILAITALTRAVPWLRVGPRLERVLSPIIGGLSGVLGGASMLFGPPLMIYLMALRMARDEFIATVSLLYFIGALLFTASLILVGAFGPTAALHSTLALIPVFGGMFAGQAIGRRLDQRGFERVLDLLYVMTALTFFYKAFA